MWQRGMGRGGVCEPGDEGRQRLPRNSLVGFGNQSPWSGEPWTNHGEPDHRKTGKCPELRDGSEVSAGVRVDPEVPGSMPAGTPKAVPGGEGRRSLRWVTGRS